MFFHQKGTLLEISLSSFFSSYFGVLFLSIGGTILYRVRDSTSKRRAFNATASIPSFGLSRDFNSNIANSTEAASARDAEAEAADQRRRRHLKIFSYLTLSSGLMCLFLDNEWYFHLPRLMKVPIYCLLGN